MKGSIDTSSCNSYDCFKEKKFDSIHSLKLERDLNNCPRLSGIGKMTENCKAIDATRKEVKSEYFKTPEQMLEVMG